MVPLALASGILGGIQTIGSLVGMSQLGKMPSFTASPDLINATNQYRQLSTQGFTPEEEAAYQAQIARQGSTAYQRGIDLSGGNMAQALLSSQGANNLAAANQMAATGAQLRRQNLAGYAAQADKMQRIQDMNTQAQLQRRGQAEQALGQALQSGLNNIGGFFNYNQALNNYKNTMLGGEVMQEPITQSVGQMYPVNTAQVPYSTPTTGQVFGFNPLFGGSGFSGFAIGQ